MISSFQLNTDMVIFIQTSGQPKLLLSLLSQTFITPYKCPYISHTHESDSEVKSWTHQGCGVDMADF